VYRRPLPILLSLAFVLLFSSLASAAPKDNAAKKEIDKAINQYYLVTKFDKAEGILTGTIRACGHDCSPAVIAKAWMYVGIVRGSGKQDQSGAREAFDKAFATDNGVQLDAALATADTKKTFADAQAAAGGGGGTAVNLGGGGKKPFNENLPGEMQCTPEVGEVQTRRPIPVSCTTDEDAVKAEVRYKEFGGDHWKTVHMHKHGKFFQGTVPCSATKLAGPLRVYVRAKDSSGDTVDQWGSKSKPAEFKIVPKTDAEPPSFPDRDPPDRCAEEVECPPGLPGCKSGGGGASHGTRGWGDTCEESAECKEGLVCLNGSCESAPSCDIDADCAQGKCVSGKCQMGESGGGPAGPYKKNWIGVHVAQDVALMGGTDVCSQNSQANNGFACFYSNTKDQYGFDPQPGAGDRIATGLAIATTRILVSYDRAITGNIMIGVRAGYAFGGGPKAGNASFLPLHGEVQAEYWFGHDVLGKKGIRPYVKVGGGLAQVDAKLPVTIADCANGASPNDQTVRSTNDYAACAQGKQTTPPRKTLQLDAYKKLGQGFISVGGGAMYAFTKNSGLQLNVNIMFMLPTSGQVFEPSLGYTFGF
jgi:hypothetical protein